MEGKDILEVQKILFEKRFLNEKPAETWTAAAVSAYSMYLQSIGVPYPSHTFLPDKVEALPKEMQFKLSLNSSIRFTLNGQ